MNLLGNKPKEINTAIEQMEAEMLEYPQVEAPLTHRFEKGIYIREIKMPAMSVIVGHQHKTSHWNIVLTGKAVVMMDGVRHEIQAPHCFISQPGVRKVLLVLEDMVWQTLHVTDETDIAKLEDELIIKSPTHTAHHQNLKDADELMQLICERKEP